MERKGREKGKKVLNMYFQQKVVGQASKRNSTTCLHINMLRHTRTNTHKEITNIYAHTESAMLKELAILIWAARFLRYVKAEI